MSTQDTGRPSKIRTAGLEGVCRKLASDGLGYREIASELKKRGHDVGYSAVARFLSEEATERREIARDVASEQAHTDVPLVTKSLRKWVGDIGKLVERTLDSIEDEESDPIEMQRRLSSASQSVATLVNAGSKAAKLLHDITAGQEPAAAADAFLAEAQAILERKRQREAEEEEGEPLH